MHEIGKNARSSLLYHAYPHSPTNQPTSTHARTHTYLPCFNKNPKNPREMSGQQGARSADGNAYEVMQEQTRLKHDVQRCLHIKISGPMWYSLDETAIYARQQWGRKWRVSVYLNMYIHLSSATCMFGLTPDDLPPSFSFFPSFLLSFELYTPCFSLSFFDI